MAFARESRITWDSTMTCRICGKEITKEGIGGLNGAMNRHIEKEHGDSNE